MTEANRRCRSLAIEGLEPRVLLAGNLKVSVAGGALYVRGDSSDNAVLIRRIGDNRYQVEGVADRDGHPTSINGVANGTKTFRNVRSDIDIKLYGGDDLLGIGNQETALHELLDELSGGPEFTAESPARTRLRRHLEVEMGSGDDTVALFVDVGRMSEIDLGAGADALAMESSIVGRDLKIYGRANNDNVRIRNSTIDERLYILLGGHDDNLMIETCDADRAEIKAGGSADTMEIVDLDVQQNLNVDLGHGDDHLAIGGSRARKANLRGGAGTETVSNLGGNEFARTNDKGVENTNSIHLSRQSATPGDSLVITGGPFDPAKQTLVAFSNQHGREILIRADAIAPSSVAVTVPPFLNLQSFDVGSGAFSVTVVQQSPTGVARFGPASNFLINSLPQTEVATGVVLSEHISQVIRQLSDAQQHYLEIQSAAGGTVDAEPLVQQLVAQTNQLDGLLDSIQQLAMGQVERINYGQIDGVDVFLDRAGLLLADQIYVSFLLDVVADSSADVLAPYHESTISSDANSSVAETLVAPEQVIADQIRELFEARTPDAIYDFADKYLTATNVAIGVGTIAAVAFGAPVVATLAAGTVLGAMATCISTWVPGAIGGVTEASTQFILDDGEQADFDSTRLFFSDRFADQFIDSITGFLTDLVVGENPAGQLVVRGVETALEIADLASSTTLSISQNFATIHDNLFPGDPPQPPPNTDQFDGDYMGSYSGMATDSEGSFPVSGSVALTVSNGEISVTEPGSGSGTLTADGSGTFAAATGGGFGCDFGGDFFTSPEGVFAGGSWTCSFEGGTAEGGWSANRIGS
jgi:hypothetical protein